MTEITGRSPNKFGCLMLHLKLAAIYLENFLFVAVQQLGQSLRQFSFCRCRLVPAAGRRPLVCPPEPGPIDTL